MCPIQEQLSYARLKCMLRYTIQLDIQSIIARGLAMKERGEKFFDSGSREMGTYGKMIVRGLGEVQIPVFDVCRRLVCEFKLREIMKIKYDIQIHIQTSTMKIRGILTCRVYPRIKYSERLW